MYLKRLELHGFKSFADRTELEFVKGITAVVGPNGSGKSNISDSVRWVLGEQSAKSLRGAKMEDIIFAGSDSRKGLNYGEVSLTLDNADGTLDLDFSEVTVTRRVYRTGESEYLINKETCRLKDITELFMDTGLGKEAYSIIGQGRIEEILSTKAEDRRGIFEEAAGIVKYKTRKREATKKLDETEANLSRVYDIITELKEQEGPLEQQAKAAKEYRMLKEQLKQSEVGYYVHQIESVNKSWEETSTILEDLDEQRLTLSTSLSQQDAVIEKKRSESYLFSQQLDELQRSLLEISEEVEKLEGQRELNLERERNQIANLNSYEENLDSFSQKQLQLEEEITQYKQKKESLIESIKTAEQELKSLNNALILSQVELSEGHADKLKADLIEVLNEMASSRNDIRHLRQAYETTERRKGRIEEENASLIQQRNDLQQKHEELKRSLNGIEEQIEACILKFKDSSMRLEELKRERDIDNAATRKEEQQLDAMKSRLELLSDMQNDYAGFQQGVKEILKAKETNVQLKGVHGAVAELIEVPAKVETAIETALGGALQNVVVDNEATGRAGIQFLKQHRFGRATFLPLNVIEARKPGSRELQSCLSINGFIGLAAELVKTDQQYEAIVHFLLGQVFVADTLENANAIARAVSYRYRVVTLDGDIVNPGGSMSGGSIQKRTTSLLGRGREIEQLEEQIASQAIKVDKQKLKMEAQTKAIQESELLREQLRAQGEQLRIEQQKLLGEEKEWSISWKTIQDRLQLFDHDRGGFLQEIEQINQGIAKAEAKLVTLESEEKELLAKIDSLEARRKTSNEEKEETDRLVTDIKITIAKLRQEEESIGFQYDRLVQERDRLIEEKMQVSEKIDAIRQFASNNQLEATDIQSHLSSKRIVKEQLVANIAELKEKRLQSQQLIEHLDNETKALRRQVKEVEDSHHRAEVKKNRLDVELDHLLNKLQEEYEMRFEMAKERFPVPDDLEATKTEIKRLKGQIASLGDVNLGAIEDYDRLTERLQHLTSQFDDLVEAKNMLYEVINEIEQEMSKRFIETFEAIQYHFQRVFVKLFGGGRADLVLSEPENILTTGVDIVAQPPGKKLQNLALLSGGERALTAIALLFAILHVKPVPFCILDEVEAALDEANVARFAQYLREFSGETQFIVVTHRKGTMEEADVLYGVTMQESGVSKLVSVKLEDQKVATA